MRDPLALTKSLLADDEPAPVAVYCPAGASEVLLTCDHASARIPRSLQGLQLPANEALRHIGWDIGALGLTIALSNLLDACAVTQAYSRLVIDCNRPLESADSIATVSEVTVIPGNTALSPAQIAARQEAIFWPYHARISAFLNDRLAAGRPTVLVAMHSFTPVFKGVSRPWHIGVLYNRDPRLGRLLLAALNGQPEIVVGDNEPYNVGDETDYAIPVHGEQRAIPHVELEVRQDLISDAAGQLRWACVIAQALTASVQKLLNAQTLISI